MKKPHSECGMTLIEVTIYIAVSVFLYAAVSGILVSALCSWHNNTQQVEAQQAVRMAVDAMVRELRQAVSLEYDPNNPYEISYIEPKEHSKISFYEHSGVLYRHKSQLIPQPIAGVAGQLKVTHVAFTVYPDWQAVDIELAVSWYDWNRKIQVESLKTTVNCVNCRLGS